VVQQPGWVEKAKFIMNQFGFAAGGPVIIPKICNGRGKTFIFADFQGTRRIQGVPSNFTVPTAQERTGDFRNDLNTAGALVKIYNPFSTIPNPAAPGKFIRTQFSSNMIPNGMLDPVTQQILKYIPLLNTSIPGSTINFAVAPKLTIYENAGSVRIDQNVTKNYRLFARYAFSPLPKRSRIHTATWPPLAPARWGPLSSITGRLRWATRLSSAQRGF
jgi:hypothetical protein